MSRSNILVDTNVYLRLAKTIRPLLNHEFGEQKNCLCIIPELNGELAGRRLQTKFPWVDEDEYVSERTQFPQLSRENRRSIDQTFGYLWNHVQEDLPGPSRVDARYLAHGIELGCVVVTDDQDMTELASTFDAKVMTSLELLKLMLDCGRIDMNTITGLVAYWRYDNDLPANFSEDYRRLFGTAV